jgi:formylmethanofuran dehydrogenase subunit E
LSKISYPREEKDGEKEKLKKRIRKLEKENTKLKSELNTLESAFHKTARYLKDNTDAFSVEKIIDAAKKEKPLIELKNEQRCGRCNEFVKPTKIRNGYMKFCQYCKKTEILPEND